MASLVMSDEFPLSPSQPRYDHQNPMVLHDARVSSRRVKRESSCVRQSPTDSSSEISAHINRDHERLTVKPLKILNRRASRRNDEIKTM